MHPADASPTRDSLALRLQGLQAQPASSARPAWRLQVANALWQRLDSADPALQRALSARLHECLQQLEKPAPEGASPAAYAAPATTPGPTAAPSTCQTLGDVARTRPGSSAAQPGTGPELQAMAPFRQAWAQVNARQRVRQGQRQEPANAGPLNPHKLAQRTLALADELSPHYLTRLVHMLDALVWLEQAAVKPPPRAGGAVPKTKAKRR